MNWILCEGYETLCQKAGERYINLLRQKPNAVLGLATGSTPLGLYRYLVAQYQKGRVDFSGVTTFNLDEYVPMDGAHPQSYRYFMNENLFYRVNVDMQKTHVPKGEEGATGKAYDKAIACHGGIDLQLLGVGHNGHIGFNEPADSLIADTHITRLAESTLQANARFFSPEEPMPVKAITMGMATILSAREIICLITGRDKHPVVQELLHDEITTACPATFLKLHPNVTVYCDREAYEG